MASYPKHGRSSSTVLPAVPDRLGSPNGDSTNPKTFTQPERASVATPASPQPGLGYPNADAPNRSKDGDTTLPDDDALLTGVVSTGAGAQPATTNVTPSATRFGVTRP